MEGLFVYIEFWVVLNTGSELALYAIVENWWQLAGSLLSDFLKKYQLEPLCALNIEYEGGR